MYKTSWKKSLFEFFDSYLHKFLIKKKKKTNSSRAYTIIITI